MTLEDPKIEKCSYLIGIIALEKVLWAIEFVKSARNPFWLNCLEIDENICFQMSNINCGIENNILHKFSKFFLISFFYEQYDGENKSILVSLIHL